VPIASATPTRVMLDQFMEVLTTCTAATVAHGGTTTQRPDLFARALRGAKRELDPTGMLNPGVLIDP
jgi:alkyldihydroxyacetonephosphate synthase